jgi:DNA-binding transcriptional ArsR family regulator
MQHSYKELLRLSQHEQKVLMVLPIAEGVNISTIARHSHIPRMSVYLALDSLKQRGLIDYIRKGKRRFWKKLSPQEFSTVMAEAAQAIHHHKERVEIKHSDTSGFTVLKGLPQLFTIFEKIALGHKGERLLGIQPTSSMKHVVTKLSWNTLKPIQDAIRKNKIIVQGLVREDYYPTLISLLKTSQQKKQALESFSGRLTDMVFVSNEYLHSETELMMFRDVAFLVNWKDEVALEIKNKEMLSFMKECFDLARGYGKKIDQNEYLRGLVSGL